jgi:hypothetical protein
MHVQLAIALLPSAEVEFPVHALQSALSTASLYFPAVHAAHTPSVSLAFPEKPAMHSQSATSSLCSLEVEFPVQAVQFVLPNAFLYFPAVHAVHFPPGAFALPENAIPQLQSAIASLPSAEVEFAVHAVQFEFSTLSL